MLPLATIYFWGACEIAIHDAKATQAAEISFGISAKHIENILILNTAYVFLRVLFFTLFVILLAISPLSKTLPYPIKLNFLTYQKINAIPIVSWVTNLFELLTWPWWLAVLTKTYTIFSAEVKTEQSLDLIELPITAE